MESVSEIFRVLQVVLGIGLVIFVHELGHYIAARMCGVRVETFSLGFGPRLFGWRRRGTMYQVALIPLGGFCRMAGEERRFDGLPPEPDELLAKGVGQRFFIYSGGVIMNVAFGLVVFPILFRVGVPFLEPRIGDVVPGGAAWRAGIQPGSDVASVNGNDVFEFWHIPTEVALGDARRAVVVLEEEDDQGKRVFELTPDENEYEGIRSIGVKPDFQRDEHGHVILDVQVGSSAHDAGLRTGDRLIEVVDGIPGIGPIQQMLVQGRGERPLILRVETEEGTHEVEVAARALEQLSPPRVGFMPPHNLVLATRDTPLLRTLGLQARDSILTAQGVEILRFGDFRRALLESNETLEILVDRGGERLTLTGPQLDQDAALKLATDIALVQADTTEIVVQPGEPAQAAGMRDRDRVMRVDGTEVRNFTELRTLVARAGKERRAVVLRVERFEPGSTARYETISVQPRQQEIPSYGLSLRPAEYLYRSDSLSDAVGFGVYCSWKFLQDTWLTLKRMVTGDVSTKSMGGIITIGAVSYSLTEYGWPKLFFFLCLLSINLAVLNVLPIPVLDGGHLFFLIVEKVKGSPVSERVLGYSQMVGVVLILSLLVYVTYNDLMRWVFPS